MFCLQHSGGRCLFQDEFLLAGEANCYLYMGGGSLKVGIKGSAYGRNKDMISISRRQFLGSAAAGAATFAMPGLALAQKWPAGPINLVLGFPAGGGLDAYVRLLSPFLSEKLGEQILVENRTGANGNIATENVIRAKPDGHTLLFSTASAMAAASYAFPDLSFNPIEDLNHITLATQSSYVLLGSKELKANTWPEFVELAKSEPGKLVHACAGVGSVNHLLGELLSIRAGIKLNTVQYKGGAPAMTDLLANQAQLTFISVGQAEPYVKSGQLKAILNCAPARAKQLPDVAASTEFGIADVDQMSFWISASAPKNTPAEIVNRIQQAIVDCYKNKDLTDRMATAGLEPVGSTPAEFTAKLKADHDLYGRIIKAASLTF
ncbi:tripartite tricarboxylate transporter substrate binding protein [Sinorhizobium meliloti]|nr:tripartite tricarboxylate transporter substrate binding protein [Sinorhizobium meliloti]